MDIKPEYIAEIKRISKERDGKEMSDEEAFKRAREIFVLASLALKSYFSTKKRRSGLQDVSQDDGYATPQTSN